MQKKLTRSTKDYKVSGVCGGIGEFLDIDPTIIRVIWAFLVFGYGTGLLLYIIFALVLPTDDEFINKEEVSKNENNSKEKSEV